MWHFLQDLNADFVEKTSSFNIINNTITSDTVATATSTNAMTMTTPINTIYDYYNCSPLKKLEMNREIRWKITWK